MKLGFTQKINNKQIPIYFQQHIPQNLIIKLKQCKKFQDYIQKLRQASTTTHNSQPITEHNKQKNPQHKAEHEQAQVQVQKIQIKCILTFRGERIGYVTIKVVMKFRGKYVSEERSFVFMRGGSVAILLFVNQGNKIAVVQQYRVPAQKSFIQPPAGMIDESGNLTGKIIKQTSQQTGIKLTKQPLTYMGSIIPQPSICDEQMHLYYGRIQLSEKKMQELEKREHGEVGSQEKLRLKFIEYDPVVILGTGNCAFIALAGFYEILYRKEGLK